MVLLPGLYTVERVKGKNGSTQGQPVKQRIVAAHRTTHINPDWVGNAPLIQRTAGRASMAFNSSTVLINQ